MHSDAREEVPQGGNASTQYLAISQQALSQKLDRLADTVPHHFPGTRGCWKGPSRLLQAGRVHGLLPAAQSESEGPGLAHAGQPGLWNLPGQ